MPFPEAWAVLSFSGKVRWLSPSPPPTPLTVQHRPSATQAERSSAPVLAGGSAVAALAPWSDKNAGVSHQLRGRVKSRSEHTLFFTVSLRDSSGQRGWGRGDAEGAFSLRGTEQAWESGSLGSSPSPCIHERPSVNPARSLGLGFLTCEGGAGLGAGSNCPSLRPHVALSAFLSHVCITPLGPPSQPTLLRSAPSDHQRTTISTGGATAAIDFIFLIKCTDGGTCRRIGG